MVYIRSLSTSKNCCAVEEENEFVYVSFVYIHFDYRFLSILLVLSFQSVTAAEEKYAFVTMYYPFAHQSTSDMIAIRTLHKSYLALRSKAEFLVLSTENIPRKDIATFEADNIEVRLMPMPNPYKQYRFVPDYQKTKNIEFLWLLKNYKRVIFVDPYTILNHNFDSLFDCSYLCLRDEQPLVFPPSTPHS